METLFLVSKGLDKLSDEEIRRREETDIQPRTKYFEDELNTHLLDERHLETVPWYRKVIYALLPVWLTLIIEAWFVHEKYDAVISYYERVGLPFALLQKMFGSDTPHILMTTWLSKGMKAWFLKHTYDNLAKIITWSSVQHDFAVNELGIPQDKIKLVNRGTDHKFWRPMKGEGDMICSAGMEQRDYPTLIKALKPLDISCHIATGKARGELYDSVENLYKMKNIPEHISIGNKQSQEMREMYARSRFVVVPLQKTNTDNGLTVILEAMAMGKPVICSRVEGQVDVIEDGVTGLYVPQGDSEALREAILDLWNNPEKAALMGKAARRYIEEVHNLEQFVESIKSEVVYGIDEVTESTGIFNLKNMKIEA